MLTISLHLAKNLLKNLDSKNDLTSPAGTFTLEAKRIPGYTSSHFLDDKLNNATIFSPSASNSHFAKTPLRLMSLTSLDMRGYSHELTVTKPPAMPKHAFKPSDAAPAAAEASQAPIDPRLPTAATIAPHAPGAAAAPTSAAAVAAATTLFFC